MQLVPREFFFTAVAKNTAAGEVRLRPIRLCFDFYARLTVCVWKTFLTEIMKLEMLKGNCRCNTAKRQLLIFALKKYGGSLYGRKAAPCDRTSTAPRCTHIRRARLQP